MKYTERARQLHDEAREVAALPFFQKATHIERIALQSAALMVEMATAIDAMEGERDANKPGD